MHHYMHPYLDTGQQPDHGMVDPCSRRCPLRSRKASLLTSSRLVQFVLFCLQSEETLLALVSGQDGQCRSERSTSQASLAKAVFPRKEAV